MTISDITNKATQTAEMQALISPKIAVELFISSRK